MMSTTYDIIGLEEAEKKRALTTFRVQPAENTATKLVINEPVMKTGGKATVTHDRGRKRKEKGKLF